jgi:hypothetical protein
MLSLTGLVYSGYLLVISLTHRTAVYGPVRTVVLQGQRVTAYLCRCVPSMYGNLEVQVFPQPDGGEG